MVRGVGDAKIMHQLTFHPVKKMTEYAKKRRSSVDKLLIWIAITVIIIIIVIINIIIIIIVVVIIIFSPTSTKL